MLGAVKNKMKVCTDHLCQGTTYNGTAQILVLVFNFQISKLLNRSLLSQRDDWNKYNKLFPCNSDSKHPEPSLESISYPFNFGEKILRSCLVKSC